MERRRVLYLEEFRPMDWFWVAKGLAKELTHEVAAYREIKGKIKEDWCDDIKDFCYQVADCLLVAIHEHDSLVRRLDPCSDVETLRYDDEISKAIDLLEDL